MILERGEAEGNVPGGLRDRGHLALAPVFSDHMVLQREAPIRVWGWATPGEDLAISLGPRKACARADMTGRWDVVMEPFGSPDPLTLCVEGANECVEVRDILLGEVWLCAGQSNMEFLLRDEDGARETTDAATHPAIRHLTIPRALAHRPQAEFDACWNVCSPESVGRLSAVGYHFGARLHRALDCPVGLIVNAYGGSVAESWVREECLKDDPELSPILQTWERFVRCYPEDPEVRNVIAQANFESLVEEGKIPPPWGLEPKGPEHFHRPSILYNAMVHPLIPLTMRGVIWYQGEANAHRSHQYRKLLPALIADWRRQWNLPDLWFLLVQLPNFDAPWLGRDAFAEMREAQAIVARETPHTGLACTVDLGQADEIHPTKKTGIADRLAKIAMAKVYDRGGIFSGPTFRAMKREKSRMHLLFDHADGLHAIGGEPLGFTVAGLDRRFIPARAGIDGESVWIEVAGNPVAVRYAWANDPPVNLFNKAELPMGPFRTDSWPLATVGHYEPEAF